LQGAKGLNRIIPVEFEATIKIFGTFSLSDKIFEMFYDGGKRTQEDTKDFIHLIAIITFFALLILMLFGYILVKRNHSSGGTEL
jgi:amino acid permease